MLTKEDKSWLVESLVTRGEYDSDISDIKNDLKELKRNVNKILNTGDKYAGNIADLQQENKMGASDAPPSRHPNPRTRHRDGTKISE